MSAERFTLDTNLLVYFHDFTDPVKQSAVGADHSLGDAEGVLV